MIPIMCQKGRRNPAPIKNLGPGSIFLLIGRRETEVQFRYIHYRAPKIILKFSIIGHLIFLLLLLTTTAFTRTLLMLIKFMLNQTYCLQPTWNTSLGINFLICCFILHITDQKNHCYFPISERWGFWSVKDFSWQWFTKAGQKNGYIWRMPVSVTEGYLHLVPYYQGTYLIQRITF